MLEIDEAEGSNDIVANSQHFLHRSVSLSQFCVCVCVEKLENFHSGLYPYMKEMISQTD